MASRALNHLITQVKWGELDYLLIDMPPGTSDIHLSLVQTLPIGGAIVVSTPQEVALADARKGVSMFLNPQVNVPVLGIVENMAWFTPAAHPDERYYIFGRDGALRLAEKMGVPVLGQIPLVADICQCGDEGDPIASRDSITGEAFRTLASRVVEAMQNRNTTLPPTRPVETH
jgi:ATP-binding protein involved in chromosome partitioning